MAPLILLRLEPAQNIVFGSTNGPKVLRLTNLHGSYVAYKVKTTAPRAYLVRPSSGTLGAGESIDVQIIQQQGPECGTRDRFLVQAVEVSNDQPLTKERWTMIQSQDPSSIQEQQLSVILPEPSDQPDTQQASAPRVADAAVSKHTTSSTGAPDSTGGVTSGGGGGVSQSEGSQGGLKNQYDELVTYTLRLEQEKKYLEDQARKARQESDMVKARAVGRTYSTTHMVLVAIVGIFLAFIVRKLEAKPSGA